MSPAVLEVRKLAGHGRGLRLRLAGIDTRDAAEALRGQRVWADARELEALPEGELYGYEIVGCEIRSEDGAHGRHFPPLVHQKQRHGRT